MTYRLAPDTFARYMEGRAGARFTDWLRERAEPAWTLATTHRFVRLLADDELDDAVFTRYLIQDYAFIEWLVSFVGLAVARAPSIDEKKRFVGFLAALTSDENDYFARSFDALGVPDEARHRPTLNRATQAFRELMMDEAGKGGYEAVLAVLVPTEWVYSSGPRRATVNFARRAVHPY